MLTMSFFCLQGVTSWHHGSDFGQQIKSLLDFGKAEMENSDLHETGQIFYPLKYLEISLFSRDTKTTRFSGNNYILIK